MNSLSCADTNENRWAYVQARQSLEAPDLAKSFAELRPALLRTAQSIVKDPDWAADIVNNLQIAMLDRIRNDGLTIKVDLAAYLGQSVRNRALNALRDERRRIALGVGEATASSAPTPTGLNPESAAIETDRQMRLERYLRELNPNHQEVLRLYYYEGLRKDEIAAALRIPAGTVISRMNRAREALRELFSRDGITPAMVL